MPPIIIEADSRVFEVVVTPDPDEVPESCRRTARLRQLSGPPVDLTLEQAREFTHSLVRALCDVGLRVYVVRWREED